MKYYVIAGEASGDLHASNLVKAIKTLDKQAEIRAWGGDLLEKQGATLVKHYRDLAFMGFKEVIANLGTILKNITLCKNDIESWKPDVIIFVDYPGFNMRIAEWAKKKGFKTVYYISPQVWAWKEKRAEKLKRDIDKMIVILPFEEEFFGKYQYGVEYVGHPLLDVIPEFKPTNDFRQRNGIGEKPIVAMLPGSRKQEILKKLPVMLQMQSFYPEYEFVIAGAPGQDASFYESIIGSRPARIVYGQTYDLLSHSYAAMVTSGTATLETALFEVPEVVCYKGSSFSYEIGKRLVKVPFISLVNLIMGGMVVKELIQYDMNEHTLKRELQKLLHNEQYRHEMIQHYKELKQKLGGTGASMRAARSIYDFGKGKK
jgi:lipid-A-disaccharide synthase